MPRNYKTTQRRRLLQQQHQNSVPQSHHHPSPPTSSILESITENLGSATSNSSCSEKISSADGGENVNTGGEKKDGEVGLPLFTSSSAFPEEEKLLQKKDQDGNVKDDLLNNPTNYDNVENLQRDYINTTSPPAAAVDKVEEEEEVKRTQPQTISPSSTNLSGEESTIVSEQTNTPMIYVNDSDSVSQITSSIAGSSSYYYQPPIRGPNQRYNTKSGGGGNMSVGDSAAGDSLDEIAFLLHPTPSVVQGVSQRRSPSSYSSQQQQNQNNQPAASARYTNRFNSISSNPKGGIASSSSLYSDSPSTLQNNIPPLQSSSLHTTQPTPPSVNAQSKAAQSTTTTTILSHLSKITLPPNALSTLQYIRHRAEHIFLPPPLRSSKKNDDVEEEDVDYFEKLMSPDFLLNGSSSSVAPSTLYDGASTIGGTLDNSTINGGGTTYISVNRTKKQEELSKRKFWFTIFRLGWLCMLLSSFLVGLKLVAMDEKKKKKKRLKVDLGNERYEWDSNLGMIRPAASGRGGAIVEEVGGGNVGAGGGVRNNNHQDGYFDIPPGDPLQPLLPSSKLRPEQQQQQSMRHIGLPLPPLFDNLADVTDFPTIDSKNIMLDGVGSKIGGPNGDLPFFWHIPRTGGATMNDVLGSCLRLSLASDAGGREGHDHDEKLTILRFTQHFSYVNVDTSTIEGIERAKRLNLASSGLADVVISSLLHEATKSIFTSTNKGRMFTIFRHPIERAVSLFHYVQDTQWRRSANFNQELAELTIEEYFKGGLAENNWMVRFLTGELTKGELNEDDLDLAKEILRRKCLVGLLKEKGESFARVERYFGWHLKTDEDKECYEKKLEWAWPLKHRHDDVQEGTELWDLIMRQNVYDVQLYEYAELLFQEQAQFFQ